MNHSHGHGPSSFWMHEPETVFGELGLASGEAFLDLGCGPGDYAVRASRAVGESGTVYAFDMWEEMIATLEEKKDSLGTNNIRSAVSDLRNPLPVGDGCIDVCLVATVLHTPSLAGHRGMIFSEIKRVLKPGGRLAVIECRKEETPFGPPLNMRLSPEEIERLAVPCGFRKTGVTELGNNYMIRLVAE